MQSVFRNMLRMINDAREGRNCNCQRPHLLTFPDVDDNYEIMETREIEKATGRRQYVKTEVTARCRICGTLWMVEITTSPERRTRTWSSLNELEKSPVKKNDNSGK